MRPFYRRELFRDEIITSMPRAHEIKIDLENVKLELIRMEKGQSITLNSEGYEMGVILLSGSATVKMENFTAETIGDRKDVFSGKPTAVYIPCATQFEMKAVGYGILEVVLCKVKTEVKGNPFVISPDQVVVKEKGVFNWKRTVHEIFTNQDEAQKQCQFIIGETYGCPGQWATYPYSQEERSTIFFFKVKSTYQKEVYVMRTTEDDKKYYIKNDTTLRIDSSYVPIAEAEDAEVYYLWFMIK